MEQYIKNLIEQFRLATGNKNTDLNSDAFITEFAGWIRSRQKIGKEYTYFLDYMELRFADPDCAEIGKGVYDTVVKPFDTKLITPADQSFEKLKMKDRIITGNMRVYEECPVLVRHNIKGNRLDQIPNDIILTYITQNPFSQSSISGWEGLHNSGNNNIIVGIYGNVFDKDAESKIKLIEALKSKLSSDDFKEDYSTLDDKYFYAIGSQRMVKKLVKTRTR